MKLPKFLKPFIARIAKTPKEVIAMPDETVVINAGDQLPPVTAATPMPAVQPPAAAPVLNTDTLKAVLAALGYPVPAVWDEAIAISKKSA
ncbi:hypothetical protein QN399_00975 [Pseudomonas sp. 10C3]|uniref:hypothetical protein n=1 Tax=Pseudomonas sp. 10C3 TaxID=3118753 RepID=UPI002E806434|nr:hypothetical protein [Pseudomonas sp. 10C3]MEE3504848.1 hypothetical protein [Pseudomonas sp. 10C3]